MQQQFILLKQWKILLELLGDDLKKTRLNVAENFLLNAYATFWFKSIFDCRYALLYRMSLHFKGAIRASDRT